MLIVKEEVLKYLEDLVDLKKTASPEDRDRKAIELNLLDAMITDISRWGNCKLDSTIQPVEKSYDYLKGYYDGSNR